MSSESSRCPSGAATLALRALASAAALCALALAVCGGAAAAAPGGPADFNGDGFADLAVGVPAEDVGLVSDAGVVHVLYGSPAGLSAAGSQYWSQNSAGITDVAEAGDGFGAAVTTGDFNGDGFGDLAVGVPNEDSRTLADIGVVHVIHGGAGGLAAAGSEYWSQDGPGVPDIAEAGDHFGSTLASANFAGESGADAEADLAVGVPDEDVGAISNAGAVQVFYGSAGALLPGTSPWNQETPGIADAAEAGDRFGAALAAADFGLDFSGFARSDLAIGVSGENLGAIADAGVVHVIHGTLSGLTADGSQYWSQDSAGITDAAEAGDHFGAALAAGDLGRGTHAELAVGVPDEDARTITDTGAVHVIYGTSGVGGGLHPFGSQYWSQSSSGIADTAEAGDRFGSVLAIANFDDVSSSDLAVGVPDEDVGTLSAAGVVQVIYSAGGSPGGLSPVNSQYWDQNSLGVADAVEAGDRFGAALAGADFGRAPTAELAVGVPVESIGRIGGAGAVHLLYGVPGAPLSGSNSQFWNQESAGITDTAETGDRFGAALAD